jgi:pimeloyl-ACP methyl ester carboxylesterase
MLTLWRRARSWWFAVPLLAALAAAGAAWRQTRGWRTAPDPTGGDPLRLPDGEDRTVTAPDGAALAVRVAGPPDGPTVVLIHGWTNDRRVWGPVGRRLVAAGCRVVLYDQRGHGQSGVGDGGLSIQALGADLLAVLRSVGAHDAVIAGHSMGGMAAQVFMLNHSADAEQRVKHLFLVASACNRVQNTKFSHHLTDLAVADRAVRSAAGRHFVRFTLGSNPVLAQLDAVRAMFVATPPHIRGGLRRAMYGMDLSDELRHLTVPVTVVAATMDRVLPASRSRHIAALVPHAQLHVIDAGHMLPWEAVDDIATLITDVALEQEDQALPA